MRHGYRAFRFAYARNANISAWASEFNAGFGARRGLSTMTQISPAFGCSMAANVMGESPILGKGFSEQVRKMAGTANVATDAPTDVEEEVDGMDLATQGAITDSVRQLLLWHASGLSSMSGSYGPINVSFVTCYNMPLRI